MLKQFGSPIKSLFHILQFLMIFDIQYIDHPIIRQLEVLLEERMRSWTRKELEMSNPIPKSLTKMRTVIHQQQIDFNQRLAPHCSRLNKWNEDISYLDNKFTGYAELNQLKEAILDSEGNNTEEHKLDPIDHRTKLNKTKSNSFNKMVNTKKTRDTASKSVLKPQLKSKQKSKSKTKAYSKRASVSVTTSVLTPGTTPSTRLNRSDAVIHKDLDDDDGYYELDAEILLRQYLNCSNLVAAQRARAETVDEYIVPLNERKTRLRRIVRQYESDIGSMQSKHDKLDSKYRALTEKRSSIQDQIDKLVTTLNATIEEENETMRTAVQTKNDLNVLKLEKKGYEILLQTSRSLSSSYQRYLKDIQSASHKLNVYFVKRWEEHEARWPKWSGDDVLNWLRCLNETECPNKIQLSSTINLNVVKQGIKRHGICGSTLDQMDRNDWIHVGVQLLEDRIQIHERIQSMVHKFPRPKLVKKQSMSLSHRSHVHVCGPGGTGPMMMDCEVVAVPEEFKCPITGEIMHHPVRCADNKLYDRQNVICYLRKYGHLPGSTERAGYADGDGMDNIEMTDCLKMKRAIEAFLAEHPQIEYID